MLLRNRGLQILFALALYFLFAPFLPLEVSQGLYAISLSIKELLLWMLPLTVSLFIAHAIASFEKKAPLFLLALLFFEALSNSISIWYAYGCGHLAAHFLSPIASHRFDDAFSALWHFPFSRPPWWSADKGAIAGVLLGLFTTFAPSLVQNALFEGKKIAEWLLNRIFSPLIPLFALGFVARMYKTELLGQVFGYYADLFLWLILFLLIYITLLFFLGNGRASLKSAQNLFPAAGVAFSSGCSLSTMPWTIEGASKNLQNPELAKAIIPATTNIQQVGDCIANAFLSFLIYSHFHGSPPSLAMWLPFSIAFALARFATAAVLGGAIFVMLPIYETYLDFNLEMIALILAFNVLLDPLITCSNVLANGALCRLFERFWALFTRRTAFEKIDS